MSNGLKYGRWTVLQGKSIRRNGNKLVPCKCDCGTEKYVLFHNIVTGQSKSCGCLRNQLRCDLSTGYKAESRSRFYRIWVDIKSRCNNPKSTAYRNYGGRGIRLCEEWETYQNFKRDMKDSYDSHVKDHGEIDTSIDRIDNENDYSRDNCRWIRKAQQQKNTRRTKPFIALRIEDGLEERCEVISDFAKARGLNDSAISQVLKGNRRQHKGWFFRYEVG